MSERTETHAVGYIEPQLKIRGKIGSGEACVEPRIAFVDDIVDLLVKEAMRVLSKSSRNGGLNYAVELLLDVQKYCATYGSGYISPDPFSDGLAEILRDWNTSRDGNR